MCGIFGFSGKIDPLETLSIGLKRLEYRGYDSWGMCYRNVNGEVLLTKEIGKLPLENKAMPLVINSARTTYLSGIAHTRWATHGGVTKVNAHPHLANNNEFALAQNGIVENYQELKLELENSGYVFKTQTDTEIIVALIEKAQSISNSLLDAVIKAFLLLKGRNTIIVYETITGQIIAIKNGSPLVVGKKDGDIYIGSDYLSFSNHTNNILEMSDYEGVVINTAVTKFRINDNSYQEIEAKFNTVNKIDEEIDKGGFADFMLKEIYEQPHTVINATNYNLAELEPVISALKNANQIYTLGCGTAAYAAGQCAYYLREIAKLKAIELKGYDLSGYREVFKPGDVLIAISQSGETADTIDSVNYLLAKGGKVISLVNMLGSTLSKIAQISLYSRTGPEICVASTKAFTAQISWSLLIAKSIVGEYAEAKTEISSISKTIDSYLINEIEQQKIKQVVKIFSKAEHVFVLGKGQNYYIALEGALKIKEISYKHFEGFTAGELKHGVIALVETNTPIIAILSEDEHYAEMLSAVAEVKVRGAVVIGVSPQSNSLFDYHLNVEKLELGSAIANIIPFQLIAYYLGKELGRNVDRPRNLAKSVTVK